MSIGGVFQLINNTGVQDKLIMASEALSKSIKLIEAERVDRLRREKYPNYTVEQIQELTDDWMPTLASIERTHAMFINATWKPFVALAHEYSRTVTRGGKPDLGKTFSFMFPILGEFVNDPVLYVRLKGLRAEDARDKVRYVEMLGHRLVQHTRFKVSNNELDSYTSDYYNAYWQYHVPQNKETGYLRNIGQEVPKLGYLSHDPTVDEVREYRYFSNGPQTFKRTQTDVEMWIPLLYWFKDLATSLPNFILPLGQTEIEVTFADYANLISFADYGGGGLYRVPYVDECCLYLNHIFLMPDVANIFMNRFGFQLIRVRRTHTEQLKDSEKSIRLHQIKWPVECLYVGFRPRVNLTNSQRWYKNTHIVEQTVKEAVVTGVSTIQVNNATFLEEKHPIRRLELRAHDTIIYPSLPPDFYNNYIPYRYGQHLKTPRDLGWYMLNFNMNPGEYQPSGYFNTSMSRELYLNYQSAIDEDINQPIIRPSNIIDLLVIADCINFLYCKDNTAVLRFCT